MDELRIPVMSKEVIVEFPDGVQTAGFVFIPTASPDHDGVMRLVEWLNGADRFFPFKVRGGDDSAIVNKDNILSLTAYHDRDSGDYDETDDSHKCGVCVETQLRSFCGQMIVDMPSNKLRALDVLNSAVPFIFLLDSGKEVHINKRFIVKVMEAKAAES
jgi:hypothetical protein